MIVIAANPILLFSCRINCKFYNLAHQVQGSKTQMHLWDSLKILFYINESEKHSFVCFLEDDDT